MLARPCALMHPPGMRIVVALAGALALLALTHLPPRHADARSCYRIWAEVDGSGSHHRHFVYVENDCDDWLQCTVWTDVNPQPPQMLSVAPSATESVETNGHSEKAEVRAFGNCRFK